MGANGRWPLLAACLIGIALIFRSDVMRGESAALSGACLLFGAIAVGLILWLDYRKGRADD